MPAGTASAEHRVRGSRFRALVVPVTGIDEALQAREDERRKFHNATHWVYACRLRGGEVRFDDDGEPSGTGGRPILAAIEGRGFSDVVIVVTRWFGGTKLGSGGLARAYGDAAAAALERTPGRRMVEATRVELRFPYADTGTVLRLVETHGGRKVRDTYGEEVVMIAAIPREQVASFRIRVRDATAARASARALQDVVLIPLGS